MMNCHPPLNHLHHLAFAPLQHLSSAISSSNPRSSSKLLDTVNKVLRSNGRIIVGVSNVKP